MNLIFLGTGTSQGIPVIGCSCPVCLSLDPRDRRLRSSVMFVQDDFHLIIDTGPDLRQQLLHNHIDNIDAVCYTHEHNDHVNGLDDIRPINFKWNKSIPVHAQQRVISELQRRFHYAFESDYAARPRLSVHEIDENSKFALGPFQVEAVGVNHGSLEILGFIVNGVAYLTDVKKLNDESLAKISDCSLVVLSALHKKAHRSHQSLSEALDLIEKLNAQSVLITHIAHEMGLHEHESARLPKHVSFAYDGLTLQHL